MSTSVRPHAATVDVTTTGRLDEALLALVVLLLTVPILQPLMAQQASRYTLTAAMWDDRSIMLDDYAESLSVDYAQRDGHLLSDKAPGQPVFALPAYAVYRLLGGEPAVLYRPWGNLGLWLTSVWSAAIPAAILAVLMRRRALQLRARPLAATATALALSTATMLLPFATQLFSHVLTAMLVYASLYVVRSRPGSAGGLFLAGTLAAVAVTAEYTAVLAGLVLFAVVVGQEKARSVWFVAGGVLPAIALAGYHTAAFGGPFLTGYRFSQFAGMHQQGFFGVTPPTVAMLAEVLVGDRGLLVLTPLVLVGVIGCTALLTPPPGAVAGDDVGLEPRESWGRRGDAAAGLAATLLYVLLMAGWYNATGGASPGPRYVVAALPFLVPGVAHAFAHWAPAAWTATVVGWATMGLATFTFPLASRAEPDALTYWWSLLASSDTVDNVLDRYVGDDTLWIPIVLSVATGGVLLARQRRFGAGGRQPAPRAASPNSAATSARNASSAR